jgi:hypothetical protein
LAGLAPTVAISFLIGHLRINPSKHSLKEEWTQHDKFHCQCQSNQNVLCSA